MKVSKGLLGSELIWCLRENERGGDVELELCEKSIIEREAMSAVYIGSYCLLIHDSYPSCCRLSLPKKSKSLLPKGIQSGLRGKNLDGRHIEMQSKLSLTSEASIRSGRSEGAEPSCTSSSKVMPPQLSRPLSPICHHSAHANHFYKENAAASFSLTCGV